MTQLTLPPHLYGIPDVGFGGYVAGYLAQHVHGGSRVSFRAPAPVGSPMNLETRADGRYALCVGEHVIAEGEPYSFELQLPDPPTFHEAEAARAAYLEEEHMFGDCFGCGVHRAADNGLQMFAHPVPGREIVATSWTPHLVFGDENGNVAIEHVWGCLDCPGGLSRRFLVKDNTPGVTATLAVDVQRPMPIDQPAIVYAWPIRNEGRKTWAGSAVADVDGVPYAIAESLWIDRK